MIVGTSGSSCGTVERPCWPALGSQSGGQELLDTLRDGAGGVLSNVKGLLMLSEVGLQGCGAGLDRSHMQHQAARLGRQQP